MSSNFSRSTIEVRQLSFCGFAAARCSSSAAISTGAVGGRDGEGAGAGFADAEGVRCGTGAGAAVALPSPSFEKSW